MEKTSFVMEFEERSFASLLTDRHFWYKLIATVCMVISTIILLNWDFKNSSLDVSSYKCVYFMIGPSYSVVLMLQVLHYIILFDTDLTGLVISCMGSFLLIPQGGCIIAAELHRNIIDQEFPSLLLFILTEVAGFALLVDTIIYMQSFLTDVEVIHVKVKTL